MSKNEIITITVPARAEFARSVRMLASNLAVVASLTIDEVEDVRMAAEEAFVFACATAQSTIKATFEIEEQALSMSFSLGDVSVAQKSIEGDTLTYLRLILDTVTASYEIDEAQGCLSARVTGGLS